MESSSITRNPNPRWNTCWYKNWTYATHTWPYRDYNREGSGDDTHTAFKTAARSKSFLKYSRSCVPFCHSSSCGTSTPWVWPSGNGGSAGRYIIASPSLLERSLQDRRQVFSVAMCLSAMMAGHNHQASSKFSCDASCVPQKRMKTSSPLTCSKGTRPITDQLKQFRISAVYGRSDKKFRALRMFCAMTKITLNFWSGYTLRPVVYSTRDISYPFFNHRSIKKLRTLHSHNRKLWHLNMLAILGPVHTMAKLREEERLDQWNAEMPKIHALGLVFTLS